MKDKTAKFKKRAEQVLKNFGDCGFQKRHEEQFTNLIVVAMQEAYSQGGKDWAEDYHNSEFGKMKQDFDAAEKRVQARLEAGIRQTSGRILPETN